MLLGAAQSCQELLGAACQIFPCFPCLGSRAGVIFEFSKFKALRATRRVSEFFGPSSWMRPFGCCVCWHWVIGPCVFPSSGFVLFIIP